VTIYGITIRERIPLQKELVASLEKCRDYIYHKYLNVDLTKTLVEDIFRFLCLDINWRIFIKNKKESEILHRIIIGLVIPIGEMTDSNGAYDKSIEEIENQCLYPKV